MVGATAKPTGPPQPPVQKPRPSGPPREAGATSRKPGHLAPFVRVFISVVILWHFTGIFLAALSIGSTSPLVIDIAQQPPMQWYLDLFFLNQGHSFFAPEVGPGNLVRYELFDERGNPLERGKGELPDRKEHWPRLRYHRHFMLADQAVLPSQNEENEKFWQRKYLESYAKHLLRTNEDAYSVRVRRYLHWPMPRELAVEGRKFTDPESYELLMEVVQRRSDLQPPPAPAQSSAWQNGPAQSAGRWTPGGYR